MGRVARLAGLEPTASASAGLRSIQLSYKRTMCVHHRMANGIGAEGGSRTHTPVRILRPERSASTVPPLRHISVASGVRAAAIRTVSTWWAIEDLNLGPLACEASALTAELTAQGQFHLTALAYVPPHWSGNDRVRTCDLALMKRPLYR